jgi:hypothetical protein
MISRDLAAELRRRYFGRWRGGERGSAYKRFLLEFGTLEFWNLEFLIFTFINPWRSGQFPDDGGDNMQENWNASCWAPSGNGPPRQIPKFRIPNSSERFCIY